MKNIVLFIFLFSAFLLNAQRIQKKSMQDTLHHQRMMMGTGMRGTNMLAGMGNQMNCPFHQRMIGKSMPGNHYIMLVRMLPNMKEELSLSDQQVMQLIDMQATFKKLQADIQAECAKKRIELESIQKNNPNPEELRQALNNFHNAKTNMIVAAYEASGKMKSVLTDEQKKSLDEIVAQCVNSGCMMNMLSND